MIFNSVDEFRASGFTPRVGIIGGGPAGISIAHKLAHAGIPSVIFEAGSEEYTEESQDFYKGKVIGDPYFQLDESRLRFLGGTSNHWAGWCRVLETYDFLPKEYAPHTGWPIRRSDIEPFLPEVYDILGIPGIRADNAFTTDFRAFEMYKSNHVHFGEKFLGELSTNRSIAVILNTEAEHLTGNGRTVTGVKLWSAGAPAGEIALPYFVLCTGGLENSRLLLWSNEQSNGGVVPHAEALGRYWMEHPMYLVGDAFLTNQAALDLDHEGESFMIPTPEAIVAHGVTNFHIQIETMPYHGVKKMIAEMACTAPEITEWVSDSLGSRLQCSARVHIDWEQPPEASNRVALSATERDGAGMPRIELHWKKGELDRRTLVEGTRLFATDFARKDFGRVRIADWVRNGEDWPDGMELAGNHHMGGTRMGTDLATSVVDADCRVHGIENLYVAGASVFTTAGQSTPTTTITALAVRLAEHLGRTVAS